MHADSYIWEDHRAKTHESSISDLNEGVFVFDPAPDLLWIMYVRKRMGHVNDRTVPSNRYIGTDSYSAVTDDVHVLLDIGVIPYGELGNSGLT